MVSRVKRDFVRTLTGAFPPCPAGTVMLGAGGAGTYAQRAIPGPSARPAARFLVRGRRAIRVLVMLGAAWGSFPADDPGLGGARHGRVIVGIEDD